MRSEGVREAENEDGRGELREGVFLFRRKENQTDQWSHEREDREQEQHKIQQIMEMISDTENGNKGEAEHDSEGRTDMVMRSTRVKLVMRMMHSALKISPVSRASTHMLFFIHQKYRI